MHKRTDLAVVALVVLGTLGCGGDDPTASRAESAVSGTAQTVHQRGVELTLPPEWVGRTLEGSAEVVGVVQAANFRLPETDNGVAERAQAIMTQDDILIALADYGTAASWMQPPRWEHTSLPIEIRPSDFQLLEGFRAPAEAKRSVVVNERGITIYVAFGRDDPKPDQIEEANRVLGSLTVE